MNMLLVSDFGMPSGYQAIAEGLATRISALGHRVCVLGVGYDKREINYPFGVVPADLVSTPMQIDAMLEDLHVDWLVFLMDAEKMVKICDKLAEERTDKFFKKNKVASIFPVESDPFIRGWAESTKKYFACRFTFTNFNQTCLAAAGVLSTKLGVGLSAEWYNDDVDVSLCPDKPYVLTVAANQIRKNWPDSIAIFKGFSETHPEHAYVAITKLDNRIGWALPELFERFRIASKVKLGDPTDITRAQLRGLYVGADCFLLTSAAEGICLPAYEAQAQGCPVVATNCTSLTEAVADASLIDVDKKSIFPWGNTTHYWVSVTDGVKKLETAVDNRRSFMRRVYPTWDEAADVLVNHLQMFDAGSEVVSHANKE